MATNNTTNEQTTTADASTARYAVTVGLLPRPVYLGRFKATSPTDARQKAQDAHYVLPELQSAVTNAAPKDFTITEYPEDCY